MVYVISELDQHTADFKGGSFPLSIVSSYNSCSKKKESGAWRKVSTSPRKKSGRFSSPTWNKPDLSEEGKGGRHVTHTYVGTHEVASECKPALFLSLCIQQSKILSISDAYFHGIKHVVVTLQKYLRAPYLKK